MAVDKYYGNPRKSITSKNWFQRGVRYTNENTPNGFVKALANFDISKTGNSLRPRLPYFSSLFREGQDEPFGLKKDTVQLQPYQDSTYSFFIEIGGQKKTQIIGSISPESITVIDGDTFKFNERKYRLLAVDAPEYGETGFTESKALLQDVVDTAHQFRIVFDAYSDSSVDEYNRFLVWLEYTVHPNYEWQNFNKHLFTERETTKAKLFGYVEGETLYMPEYQHESVEDWSVFPEEVVFLPPQPNFNILKKSAKTNFQPYQPDDTFTKTPYIDVTQCNIVKTSNVNQDMELPLTAPLKITMNVQEYEKDMYTHIFQGRDMPYIQLNYSELDGILFLGVVEFDSNIIYTGMISINYIIPLDEETEIHPQYDKAYFEVKTYKNNVFEIKYEDMGSYTPNLLDPTPNIIENYYGEDAIEKGYSYPRLRGLIYRNDKNQPVNPLFIKRGERYYINPVMALPTLSEDNNMVGFEYVMRFDIFNIQRNQTVADQNRIVESTEWFKYDPDNLVEPTQISVFLGEETEFLKEQFNDLFDYQKKELKCWTFTPQKETWFPEELNDGGGGYYFSSPMLAVTSNMRFFRFLIDQANYGYVNGTGEHRAVVEFYDSEAEFTESIGGGVPPVQTVTSAPLTTLDFEEFKFELQKPKAFMLDRYFSEGGYIRIRIIGTHLIGDLTQRCIDIHNNTTYLTVFSNVSAWESTKNKTLIKIIHHGEPDEVYYFNFGHYATKLHNQMEIFKRSQEGIKVTVYLAPVPKILHTGFPVMGKNEIDHIAFIFDSSTALYGKDERILPLITKGDVLQTATKISYFGMRIVLYHSPYYNHILFLSDINNPTYFPLMHALDQFDAPIVYVHPYEDMLLVFTTRDIYMVFNVPQETEMGAVYDRYYAKKIITNITLQEHNIKTVQTTGKFVTFMSNTEIYLLRPNIYVEDPTDMQAMVISQNITGVLENPTRYIARRHQYYGATGIDMFTEEFKPTLELTSFVHNNIYSLFMSADLENNDIFMFELTHDFNTGQWWFYDTKACAYPTQIQIFNSIEGPHYLMRNHPTADNGVTLMVKSGMNLWDFDEGEAKLLDIKAVRYDEQSEKMVYNGQVGWHEGERTEDFEKAKMPIRPYVDTGNMTVSSQLFKRFSELYMDVTNIDCLSIPLSVDFAVDGKLRQNSRTMTLVQFLDPESGGTILTQYTTTEMDEGLSFQTWELDVSRFGPLHRLKMKIGISGRGRVPSVEIGFKTTGMFEIYALALVFKEQTGR